MSARVPACLAALAFAVAAEPAVIAPRAWSVVGAYASAAASDLDRGFPPEAGRDFTRTVAVGETRLPWSQATGSELRLPRLAGPSIAYAVTYLEAPADCRVRLAVNPEVPHRVWLDGAPLAEGAEHGLVAGLHELLVKQRLASPDERLQVTCAGPPGLRFLAQPPWPLRPLPTAAWRHAQPVDAAALRARLAAQPLGLPGDGWSAPAVAGGAPVAGGGFLAAHIFFPVKYHQQEYRFRLRGPRPAAVWLDGRAMALADAGDGACGFAVPSHVLRQGFNRLVVEPATGADAALLVELSDPGDLRYQAEIPLPPPPAADWPAATIGNGLVSARLALPDEARGLHRGDRFERGGIIARLEYRGRSFFLDAPAAPDPLDHGTCYGPAEEWFEALAWNDARLGEPFLKLGVGLFERAAHPLHQWYCTYWPVAPLPWTSRVEGNVAEFTQVCDGPRGWGYRYVKRLVLVPGRAELRIEHELTNTGRHLIDGEQYNHNFVRLDGLAPGAGYRCDLGFAPRMLRDLPRAVRVDGQALVLTGAPEQPAGSDIAGWEDAPAGQEFTLSCPGTPVRLRVGGDRPWSKLFFFVHPQYLAVEPFFRIAAAPGETARWTRTWAFLDDGEP